MHGQNHIEFIRIASMSLRPISIALNLLRSNWLPIDL